MVYTFSVKLGILISWVICCLHVKTNGPKLSMHLIKEQTFKYLFWQLFLLKENHN